MKKILLVKSLILVSAAMLPAPSLFAQAEAPTQTQPERFSYAAKFVCGLANVPITQPAPAEPPVKRGNYATSVNIRNPWANPVIITKHVIVSAAERPQFTFNLPSSPRVIEKVPPGSALYVDCQEIVRLAHIGLGTPFIEGFVVIDSYSPPGTVPSFAMEVDVVDVTTAAPVAAAGIADTGVSSHDITPIQGRKLPAGPWPF
jgi:hypothetical protein